MVISYPAAIEEVLFPCNIRRIRSFLIAFTHLSEMKLSENARALGIEQSEKFFS